MSSATDYVATDLTVPMHFRLSFEEKIIHLNYILRNIFTNYLNIIKSFGSTNRLQPLGETLFMLRMEINVGVRFILFGFTKVTVILLFTIVFALTEIKTIVMILNRP